MADKDLTLVNGQTSEIVIKPTFEGKPVVDKVAIDPDASDLKGLITLGDFVLHADTGLINIPVTAVAVGTQTATLVFRYTDAGSHSDEENWGKSTRTLGLTITEAVIAALTDVSTPLTMDLWATKALTFKVMKGEEDITSSVTSVTVDPASIADKFEFTSSNGTHTFKSIQSSPTEVVTATAKVTIVGTHEGDEYTLPADVVLNTNINDGSIPTNRFDVEMTQ